MDHSPLLLVLAAVVGYLVGAVSPATLIARRRGVDIAAEGSGNPGATNAGRVLGRRTGVVVGLLDVIKGLVPALIFGSLWYEAGLLAGFAAVVGHVTSPFLRGRGGKGVATSLGAILGSQPLAGLVALAIFAVVVGLTRWVALGSVVAALSVVVEAYLFRDRGWTMLWAMGIALIVLARHYSNLRDAPRRIRAQRAANEQAAGSSGDAEPPGGQ